MELEIYSPSQDGFVKEITWNYEDIKREVAEKVSQYANLVYTDEQIKVAKADRAKLRKFVEALEAKRKEIKKQCLAPYENFEKQVKEIVAVVNEPILLIDGQVKNFEDRQKEEKKEEIIKIFDSCGFPEWVNIAAIFDDKWLNASVKISTVQSEMEAKLSTITNDLSTLAQLPEFAFEATEVYKSTLDLNTAISEGKRLSEIQKRKLEAEAEVERKAEEVVVSKMENVEEVAPAPSEQIAEEPETRRWIGFEAYLSTEDALALRTFFNSRGIQYRAPKN